MNAYPLLAENLFKVATLAWIFFCESVEFGPDGVIASIQQIIRPESGFGARPLPFRCSPYFVLGCSGAPAESITLVTTAAGGNGLTKEGRPSFWRLSPTGTAEIAAECGDMVFMQPGTFTFGLRMNDEVVFTIKAPLGRKT